MFPTRFAPVAALLLTGLAVGCGRSVPAAPLPEDLDNLDAAVAEWVYRLQGEHEATPDRERPFLNLCLLYRANGLDDLALQCFEKLSVAHSGSARAWYHLGYQRRDAGDLEGAVEAMADALRHAPRHRIARLRLADWSFELGRLEAAEDGYARVRERSPDDPDARLGEARLALVRDEPQSAIVAARSVLRDHPGHPLARAVIGAAESRLKGESTAAAWDWTDRLLGDDPWRVEEELFWVGYEARLALADDYLAADDPATALEVLDALRERYPDDAALHRRRGAILRGLGRCDEALDSFAVVERRHPADRAAIVAAADCALRLRRWDRALAGYERALALDPDDAGSQSRLGLVALRLQHYERAETALARALELGVDEPASIRAALRKVRELRTGSGDAAQGSQDAATTSVPQR